jgi:hypothetical protein
VSVTKINGLGAPYRSLTFRDIAKAQTNKNGLLSIEGAVTQLSSTITIPPFSAIQQGLIFKKDSATTRAAPSMDAPYFLVVNSPTNAQTDDLIFSFAKSPNDVSENETIVAEYDGYEWKIQPLLTPVGIYDYLKDDAVIEGKVGAYSGLKTILVGSTYEVSGGSLVNQKGELQTFSETAVFAKIDADSDWDRVDRVVYRKPIDSENRIGTRNFVLGGTFDTVPESLYNTEVFDNSYVNQVVKVLVASDNTAHIFSSRGYGNTFSIVYSKIASNRQSILIPETELFSGVSDKNFDASIDSLNGIHIVYATGFNIGYRKFDINGTQVVAENIVDTQSGICRNPRCKALSKVYIVYNSDMSAANNQIFFTSRALGGTLATAPKQLTTGAANLINPDIFATVDFYNYVVWEDTITSKVYLQLFDDIGTAIDSYPEVISGGVDQIGVGTLTDGATSPRICVVDNKEIFVAFRQNKGSSVYGLTLWSSKDGAFMQQLLAVGENFTSFDMFVESIFNSAMFIVSRSSSVDYVRMDGQDVSFTLNLAVTGSQQVSFARDNYGSMVQAWSGPMSGTYTTYSPITAIADIGGPVLVAGSLGNVTLTNQQMLVLTSGLSTVPKVGDRVIITGSGISGNNITSTLSSVESVSLNSTDDYYRLTIVDTFAGVESPSVANGSFANPDGNNARFVKTVSETVSKAFEQTAVDTDILLSRILQPGDTILNWIPGGKPGSLSDFLLVHGAAQVDWGSTAPDTFTIGSGMKILDMFSNIDYTVAPGGYAMSEDDALYIPIDGVTTSVTPVVTPVSLIPWATPLAVLGVIKDGRFNPHLLSEETDEMDSGEVIIIGQDLPQALRARLGILSETSYQAYSSTKRVSTANTYPEAISNLDIASGQDPYVQLVRVRGSWSKEVEDTLRLVQDAYVQIPGIPEGRNKIAAQDIELSLNGDVAYVVLNRNAGANASLTVFTSQISAITITRDLFIFARRIDTELFIEPLGKRFLKGSSIIIDTVGEELKIPVVMAIDTGSTSLPTGAAPSIDGYEVADGDLILFANPALGRVYRAQGIGVAVSWDAYKGFRADLNQSDQNPIHGSKVVVRELSSTADKQITWEWDQTAEIWKPSTLSPSNKTYLGLAGNDPAKSGGAYRDQLSAGQLNNVVIEGDPLEKAIKRLDIRPDVVKLARVIDLTTSTLPTGAACTIDSITLVNGDKALFGHSSLNGIYQIAGVGSSITWTKLYDFSGSQVPFQGAIVNITEGTERGRCKWRRDSASWVLAEISSSNKTYLGLAGNDPTKAGGAYQDQLSVGQLNNIVTEGDPIEKAIKRLDTRKDVVKPVRVLDLATTTLPIGGSCIIDGVTLVNGDKVLFGNVALNGIYQIAGVGSSITWTKLYEFAGAQSPFYNALIIVSEGTLDNRTLWRFDSVDSWTKISYIKNLDDISDVDAPSPSVGQLLGWDGSSWAPTIVSTPESSGGVADAAPQWRFLSYINYNSITSPSSSSGPSFPDKSGLFLVDGEVVHGCLIKPNELFVGPTLCTLAFGISSDTAKYAGPADLLQPIGPTNFYLSNVLNLEYTNRYAQLQMTGFCNSNPTAGNASAKILTSKLNGSPGGEGTPSWYKLAFSYSDFATSATSVSKVFRHIAAKGTVSAVIIKHNTAFSGGAISSYTLEVGISGNTSKYLPATSVFGTPTVNGWSGMQNLDTPSYSSSADILVTAISTGANLDQATQGDVEIWIMLSVIGKDNPSKLPTQPTWYKYTKTYADFSDTGSDKTIDLFTADSGSEAIYGIIVKHSVQFAGGSPSSLTIEIGVSGDTGKYTTPFSVLQSVSDPAMQFTNLLVTEEIGGSYKVKITAREIGDTLDALTAGSVDIFVLRSKIV